MRRIAIALTGLVLLAAPAPAETLERTVKANSRSAIGGFLSYEVDTCYSAEVPDVKVRQSPAHGSFQILPHEQALGKDSRCPGKKVRGLAYVYTPQRGYKGADEVVLDVPWRSNDINPPTTLTYTYRIRVE